MTIVPKIPYGVNLVLKIMLNLFKELFNLHIKSLIEEGILIGKKENLTKKNKRLLWNGSKIHQIAKKRLN